MIYTSLYPQGVRNRFNNHAPGVGRMGAGTVSQSKYDVKIRTQLNERRAAHFHLHNSAINDPPPFPPLPFTSLSSFSSSPPNYGPAGVYTMDS